METNTLLSAATTLLTLRDGQRILLSPASIDDTATLADLLLRLSSQSIRLRYFSSRSFTPGTAWIEAERMARGVATLIATPVQRAFAEAVAVAELVPDQSDPQVAHLGVVVRDDWQAHGLGTALVRELLTHAPALGFATVRADLLAENAGARRLLAPIDLPRTTATRYGETQVLLHLPDAA